MTATKAEVVDGARRIRVTEVKEILVQWDAGGNVSGIAQRRGYSRGAGKPSQMSSTRRCSIACTSLKNWMRRSLL